MIKKIIVLVLLILIGAWAVVVLTKDWILKTAVEIAIQKTTGFPTHVERLQFDLPSTLRIEGLEIRNPAGFQEQILARVPEIYVSLELGELLRHERTHLTEVRLNIQEVNIEKNEQGISNIELLKSVGGTQKKAPVRKMEKPAQKKSGMPFLLERLELTIHDVSFKDHSGLVGAAPIPKGISVDLNIDKEVFGNIQDPATLTNLILVKILQGATFGRLLNLSPERLLGEDVNQILNSGRELLAGSAGLVTNELGQVTTQARGLMGKNQVAQRMEGVVKSKVSGLWGKIKSQDEP